jgi:hypothetical protein
MTSRVRPIFALACLLLIASCGEDANRPLDVGGAPPDTARLAYSPDTLFFTIPGDPMSSELEVTKTLELWNDGADTLTWAAVETIPWLTLSPNAGSSAGEIDSVQTVADLSGLAEGASATGNILLATSTTKSVRIDTVRAVARNVVERALCVSDTALQYQKDIDPGPKQVFIGNCGNWPAEWNALADNAWILLDPRSGVSGEDGDTLTVGIDWEQVRAENAIQGTFAVYGPEQRFDVAVNVQPVCFEPLQEPSYSDETTDLYRYRLHITRNPGPLTFRLKYCGFGDGVDWTMSGATPWLSVSPPSGTSTGEWDTVTVAVDWEKVSHGDTANLRLEAGGRVIRIHVTALTCSVRITRPDTSSVWTIGEIQRIEWVIENYDYSLAAEIYLFKGNQSVTSFNCYFWESTCLCGGGMDWKVTTRGFPSGSDYRIKIYTDTEGGTCATTAWSDYFTIVVPDCYISVTRPNRCDGPTIVGDYSWHVGDLIPVKWNTHADAVNVIIDLYADGVFVRNITHTTNAGIFEWDSTGYEPGAYQVKVTDADNPECSGFSEPFPLNP